MSTGYSGIVRPKGRTLLSTTTETPIVAAPGAGKWTVLDGLILANLGANAAQIDIRDALAGTIVLTVNLAAGQTLPLLNLGFHSSAANAAWTAQATGTTPNVAVSTVSYPQN